MTNGHGSVINKRNIVPELKGLIDSVAISFNSSNPAQYAELMGLDESYFDAMINFAKESKNYVDKVVMSVVSMNEIDIAEAKEFVEKEIGVEFRERQYF